LQDIEELKREAARRALELIRPGMRLGLGIGSTARHFVDLLGARVKQGLSIVGVPTSEATAAQARALGVPLTTLDETPELDLTIDGADEVDADLSLIKGGGGALLREKIVAAAARRFVVVVDESKLYERLEGRLPVEIVGFGARATGAAVAAVTGGQPLLRRTAGGDAYISDNGNLILDCPMGPIDDPEGLADRLSAIPGVVEHGLFIGMATTLIVAHPRRIQIIERAK